MNSGSTSANSTSDAPSSPRTRSGIRLLAWAELRRRHHTMRSIGRGDVRLKNRAQRHKGIIRREEEAYALECLPHGTHLPMLTGTGGPARDGRQDKDEVWALGAA